VNGDNSSVVSGNPSCSTTATQTSAPGVYPISCTNGTLTASNYSFVYTSGTYTVTKEDARATYAGAMFASTDGISSNSATINLVATIRDITAVTGDSATDPNGGDIRNATVKFVNRDTNAVLCTASAVNLLDPSDTKVGTAGCQWTANIGNSDAATFTIGIVVSGYYTRDSSADDALVTVSRLIPGSIGGGGFLINTDSAGIAAGDDDAKTSFGFNVKSNKKGNNFQGHVNIIVNSGGHTYQIKSTAINSMVVKNGDPSTATFSGKGVVVDITNPLAPISVEGNALIQITITDNGEPGSADTIGVTIWNKQGALWFSSNWTGLKTTEQLLGGGNLQVR
jgi:hypothetical protein